MVQWLVLRRTVHIHYDEHRSSYVEQLTEHTQLITILRDFPNTHLACQISMLYSVDNLYVLLRLMCWEQHHVMWLVFFLHTSLPLHPSPLLILLSPSLPSFPLTQTPQLLPYG